MSRNRLACLWGVALAFLPGAAMAHTGIGSTSGFTAGFAHPLGGPDHLMAMVAVGLLAAHLGGRALWLVPAAFMAMMALGGVAGMTGLGLPLVEAGIALSVVVLGAAVALRLSLPLAGAMVLVGAFAVFHGHAHGGEMPETASGLAYGLGFLLATGMLHAAGIGIGLGLGNLRGGIGRGAVRLAGGAMALMGVAMLAGLA